MQLTLAELQEHRLFKLQTPKVQAFITEYLTNGYDVGAAAVNCFDTKPGASSVVRGRRVLRDEQVSKLVAMFLGEDEPSFDEYRRHVWEAIQNAKSGQERVALYNLYAQLRGFVESKGGPHREAPPSDDGADILSEMEE